MKKSWAVLLITALMLLSGCSLMEDVNNTLTYGKEATEYVSKAGTFAEEVPALAKQAVNDQQAAEDLEVKLLDMKQEMEAFNALEAPEVALEIHEQIVNQNAKVEEGIDLYLNNMENGKLDPTVLENTEIYQSIQKITNTIDQIKQLGQ
ncbi:DUF6376 family protein [Litchfieldia salsa]|uniref:Lipoprotein n=1 Tax=Litchfieldia salsa TaxID=930152 RepID=A0A1H0VCY5_9BACI|nr:DUF6376 family protein [Litchfieldia salsa]SDP76290.1 hypothetical protein SAMN05216565_106196 [Litchfieldia salsa]